MFNVWWVPVVLRILAINIIYPWFRKAKLIHTDELSFVTRFTLHYFFAAVLGAVVAVLYGGLAFDKVTWLIIAVGAANGYGAYCQWRADQHSQSMGALAGFMDDFIAITLGYWLLNESRYLNAGIGAGLALCAVSILGLGIRNYLKKKSGKEHISMKLFGYVLGYTVIWGIATFLMRYWAISDVPITKFVFGWYGGAFAMSAVIFVVNKLNPADEKNNLMNKEKSPISTKATLWMTAAAGGFIFSNILLSYWALMLAPLTVIKPVFFVSAMVPPMLIGMFVFHEKKQYESMDNALIALALIGALLIAFSFGGT